MRLFIWLRNEMDKEDNERGMGVLLVPLYALIEDVTMEKNELRETRKQMLPLVTTFSPRDSLSKLSSPLGLPK